MVDLAIRQSQPSEFTPVTLPLDVPPYNKVTRKRLAQPSRLQETAFTKLHTLTATFASGPGLKPLYGAP